MKKCTNCCSSNLVVNREGVVCRNCGIVVKKRKEFKKERDYEQDFKNRNIY